jgi:hypothetical protein
VIPLVVIPVALATVLSLPPSHATPLVLPEVLRGSATWYRAPIHHAAAGPRLRHWLGRHWRGQTVLVISASHPRRRVRVTLTDWCACGGAGSRRLVDLPARDFQVLAPLSRGVVGVRVRSLTSKS